MRRGMDGPLWCTLCEGEEETMNHLLDSCFMASPLWDSGIEIFHRTNWVRGLLHLMIKTWDKEVFKNQVIRKIWLMFPGTLIWARWKKRNGQVLKVKKT